MSSKEKPSLGGTTIKTRKRNIAVPHDPSKFANAIVQLYISHAGDLELVAKDVDSSELDFNRYGETFFEVEFAGGRLQPGTTKLEEDCEHQPFNVLATDGSRASIIKHIQFIQKVIRRRPFMIKTLEPVLKRSVQCLELYSPEDRQKLSMLIALCFSSRLTGLAPDFLFTSLLNDSLVSKGSSLSFLTEFFRFYLAETSLEELVGLLKRGKVEQRLMDFFPSGKRTPDAFAQHFKSEGLTVLVDFQKKIVFDVKLKELSSALEELISEENVEESIDLVKQRKKEGGLADADIVKTVWNSVMSAVQWSGKNQQQNINSALRQVKAWSKLLGAVCPSAKMELELMYCIQQQCYEDVKIQRAFPEIVRALYDLDVLAEDTIMVWFQKGTNTKGRNLFVQSLAPFVKWLEEAEEED